MRKIPKSLAIIGLLTPLVTPVNAGALGIGDIRIRSNLNQSLLAEIPLVTSGSDSLSDIRINLAPPEAFARAGIERQFFLSKLAFKPVQKPDGSYVIQVTSREPITEPFLNFLLEVNWPQGHLLREFTALLDPPATYEDKAVVAPVLPRASSAPEAREPSSEEPAVARPSKPKRTAAAPVQPGVTAESQGTGSYGPVQKDETLWNIARSLQREANVKPEQLMQAIFEANPKAFSRGNINMLKAGVTLVVPGIQGHQVSSRQSAAESTASVETPASKPQPSPISRPVTEQPSGGQLKLSSPSEQAPGTGASSASEPEKSATVQESSKPAESKEGDEIKSRLAELEQKLSAMQGLLTLKDQQIATLQSSQKPAEEKPVSTTVTKAPSPPAPTPATTAVAPSEPQGQKQPLAQSKAPADQVATTTPPKVTPTTQPRPAPAATAEKKETSWLPEPYYLAVGGAGTILLGALIWVTYRRRAAMLDDFESMFPRDAQESAFSEVYANQRPAEDKGGSADAQSASKSSFLVEFSASDFDALDTESDELDPISEADVYLAYGRYKQAEDLIRNAIEQHPDRDECKLKLLEIHYATENREAFESYAKDLYGQKKDSDPEFWGKVMEMGRELCPDSALFDAGESSILNLEEDDIGISSEFAPLSRPQSAREKPQEKPDLHVPSFLSKSSESDFQEVTDDLTKAFGDSVGLDFESESKAQPGSSSLKFDSNDGEMTDRVADPMSLDFDFELLPSSLDDSTDPTKIPKTIASEISDLTDMNELETKLDLAKAFVDMDDVDSAKEILEEIAKAGNEAQKEEAKTLLARIV